MPLSDAQIRVTVTADSTQAMRTFESTSTAAKKTGVEMVQSFGTSEVASQKLTAALEKMTAALIAHRAASTGAAQGVDGLDRAMASGGVRVASMEAGVGGMGMALGRVAAASSTLAPILAAAFPVIGAVALGQVIEGLVGKVEDWEDSSRKIKQEWQDIDNTLAHEGQTAEKALGTMEAKTIELTRGPLEALRFQLAQIRDEAGNLDTVTGKMFEGLEGVLKDQNLSAFDPMRWLGEGTGKLQDKLKAALPDLQETLNTEGADAGLKKLDGVLNTLYETKQNLNSQKSRGEYDKSELDAVNLLIPRLERLQELYAAQANQSTAEAGEKRAEIAKKESDLAQDALRAENEENRRSLEGTRADYEKSLEALRVFTTGQVEGARQQAQAADDTAAAFRSGSTQRITTFASEAVALKSEQAALQDGMNAAQAAGNDKAVEIYRHAYDAIGSLAAEFNRKAAAESREGAEQAAREFQRVADERLRTSLEGSQSGARIQESEVAPVATPGRKGSAGISPQQELAQKTQILQQELTEEQLAIEARQDLLDKSDADYLAKYQALQERLVQLTQQTQQKIAQLNKTASQQTSRDWNSAFQQLNAPLTGAIDGMLNGTQRVSVAFARMGASMLDSVVNALIQMTLRTVEQLGAQQVAKATANATDIAQTTATAATKNAIEGASAMKSLAHSAVSAAGKAWDALSSIPVIGPVLGAVAAAATFAGVMALGALASAEQGAVLPQDTLLLAHRNEMVLPAHISAGVQQAVETGKFGGGSDAPSGPSIHFAPQFNASAIDSRGMADLFQQHSSDMMRQFHRMVRNGSVRMR